MVCRATLCAGPYGESEVPWLYLCDLKANLDTVRDFEMKTYGVCLQDDPDAIKFFTPVSKVPDPLPPGVIGVHKVLTKRSFNDVVYYKIRWKNLSSEHDSWHTALDLLCYKDSIRDFEANWECHDIASADDCKLVV